MSRQMNKPPMKLRDYELMFRQLEEELGKVEGGELTITKAPWATEEHPLFYCNEYGFNNKTGEGPGLVEAIRDYLNQKGYEEPL